MDRDGAVLALVGGTDYVQTNYNRATDALRQPGSSWKLFVYLAAMREGMNPNSMVEADEPTRHKRILIDIRSPYAGTDEGLYRATRVVSYDPVKAEMDYENSEYYDPTYGGGDGEGGGTTSEEPSP